MPQPVLSFQGQRAIRYLFGLLFGVECLLLLADLTLNFGEWSDLGPVRRFFNVAREDGVASWFQVSQTLLVALTLWLIGLLAFADKRSALTRCGWVFLAIFYTFLAFDDGAQFHERLGSIVEISSARSGPRGVASTFPSYLWHLVLLPFFASVGLFMLYFAFRELRRDRRTLALFLLGLGTMGVAQVLDFFEGMKPDHPWNVLSSVRVWINYDREDTEHLSRALEETLEMFSMTYFWVAYLRYLVQEFPQFRVSLLETSGPPDETLHSRRGPS